MFASAKVRLAPATLTFMPATPPPFLSHFSTIAADYDVVLCDVWGVVHNGVAASPEACDALTRFRRLGGTVVLITNAPRPGEVVMRSTLDPLKVPRAAYDGIVSSGDVTRAVIAEHAGERVFHIGPARDLPMFEGLDARVAPIESADYVVCSGLYDDTVETPQDYGSLITRMRERRLAGLLRCADPVSQAWRHRGSAHQCAAAWRGGDAQHARSAQGPARGL